MRRRANKLLLIKHKLATNKMRMNKSIIPITHLKVFSFILYLNVIGVETKIRLFVVFAKEKNFSFQVYLAYIINVPNNFTRIEMLALPNRKKFKLLLSN